MLLPLGTDLARGTLRTLARRQGRRHDLQTEEQPGKILHELRKDDGDLGLLLPPVYYGTVDATPLWACLLHDAWRWGMAAGDVEALLPNLVAALDWVLAAIAEGGGFLTYRDSNGSGLVNQGWKDSGDALRFADGRLADPPIALCEVQAYAHQALTGGAALLTAFGVPGADRYSCAAAGLAERFRARFWVSGRHAGPALPALALDGTGRQVDAVTSNLGHLLGTGLLDAAESELVARRLTAPDLAGFGLRTMSALDRGYAPLSYHCGSVWPHDTTIAVTGLARAGHGDLAAGLIEGLLAASTAFDGRLPELWSGDAPDQVRTPVPYPAACRPQAWSAASVVAVLSTVLGLDPDLPGGTLSIRPMRPSPVGSVEVRGLRLGEHEIDLAVTPEGRLSWANVPSSVTVTPAG
jgi:glycogen debranching enzyme